MKEEKKMTFNDIFKTNFLEKINSFSIIDSIIVLILAFVIGLFIFIVYKKTYSGVMYNVNFGTSLIVLSMITAFVILAVTSNVVLSLGMVGALSIVRFRTAIKDPMDIVFLFWALAAGIVLGAGLIPLAVIGTIIIGIIVVVFANIKYKDTPYILAVNTEADNFADIEKVISQQTKKYIIKSKTHGKDGNMELTYEVRVKSNDSRVVDSLLMIGGVKQAALVSYNGEYMS